MNYNYIQVHGLLKYCCKDLDDVEKQFLKSLMSQRFEQTRKQSTWLDKLVIKYKLSSKVKLTGWNESGKLNKTSKAKKSVKIRNNRKRKKAAKS